MSETVINAQSLPETIVRLFPSGQVKMREDKGVITIIPLKTETDCPLFGFFADGKLSTEKIVEQKQLDKELET